MTDQPAAPDSGLTTDQIASAGATGRSETAPPEPSPEPRHDPGQRATDHADAKPRAPLLEGEELQGVLTRWKEIQANFVDEPRSAVQEADALVADLMQHLARTFSDERALLESRWASGEEVSTEDLRQGLQRYRSFFERLLAA